MCWEGQGQRFCREKVNNYLNKYLYSPLLHGFLFSVQNGKFKKITVALCKRLKFK